MASKFVEYQQLIENWDRDTIQKLVTFTKKLKAKKGEDPAVPDIYKSITNICKNVVEFYPFIYKVLYQFTESQEELQKKLTIQNELISESRKCYLLMDALSKVVPNNIEIQNIIFNMDKHGVFLHKIKTKLDEDVEEKDENIKALKKANKDLETKTAETKKELDEKTNAIKMKDEEIAKLDKDAEKREENIKALEKVIKDLETKIAETKEELDEKTNNIKMKDEEIAALKRAQVEKDTNIKQLEENYERIVKEKKAVEDESNSIKNCYYLYYLLIKSLEDEQKESKMKEKELETENKEKDAKISGMFTTIQSLKRRIDVNAGELATKHKTITALNKKKIELTATVNNKNKDIQRLNSLLDKESNMKNHLTKKLHDKKTKNSRLKQDIKTEQNRSNETERRKRSLEKRNAELMSVNEELKKEAAEDIKDVIKTCRREYEQTQRKIENKFFPTVTKCTGFLMELHSAELERATRAPRRPTNNKASDNKGRKRRRSDSELPSIKFKRQKK